MATPKLPIETMPPPRDHLSGLPVELHDLVVQLLGTNDRLSLRSTSRKLNEVCLAKGLFKDHAYAIRPYADDMGRLERVSGNETIAKGIRHLTIFVGDVWNFNF
jgi:hypothetical protein